MEFRRCFVINSCADKCDKLSEWLEEAKADSGPCTKADLSRVCWFLVKRVPAYDFDIDYELEMIMRCSLFLEDADLCRDAVLQILRTFPQSTVNEAIQQFGFNKLKSG